jgi:hypothetical protein
MGSTGPAIEDGHVTVGDRSTAPSREDAATGRVDENAT